MTVWVLQEKIHNAVREKLKPGMTEKELGEVISSVCPDWRGDLISGERTAEIEGEPTDKVINTGDTVLLDLQVFSENMWSDLTRVYFVGDVNEFQKKAYKAVLNSISVGEDMLRPGISGKQLWNAMRAAIGEEYAFTHHAGHLIDAENFYLKPGFEENTEDILKPGMTVTLEPAVYYPGKFGIRLENNYVITEDGFKRLDSLSLELSDYIVKG